ncbi:MAG: peroxiredoxin [Sulfurifustaceae bacterium]
MAVDTAVKKGIGAGDRAPNFVLTSQRGDKVELARLIGKRPIVLYFYPKDDTPICTKEACFFRDRYEDFKDAGAEVIGISSDSSDSHRKFADKHRLPFTLLSDEGGKVRALYGVPSTLGILPGRVTFIIDRHGIVCHVFSAQFRAKAHVDEALRVLKSL